MGEQAQNPAAHAKPSRGRNPRQEEQRRATRRALLSAAAHVFETRGYVETSVEHVLEQAGISRAAFYSHFDGKLALICAIADDFAPQWEPVFEALTALRDPSIDDLERWARRHLEFHAEHKSICSLLTQVALLEDRLYRRIAEQQASLIETLARAFPAFREATRDPAVRLRAQLLLWQTDQTCFMVVRGRVEDPEAQVTRHIAEQIHRFLIEFGGQARAP